MKITYLTDARLPTDRANGVNIVNMAQALTVLGNDVELVHLRRRQPPHLAGTTIDEHYGIDANFTTRSLANVDGAWLSHIRPPLVAQAASFAYELVAGARLASYAVRTQPSLVWTRHFPTAWWLRARKQPVVLEIHRVPRGPQLRMLRATARSPSALLVAISDAMRVDLRALGISGGVMVARSGVPTHALKRHASCDQRNARQELGLPLDETLVVYTGQLLPEKGGDTLVRAAAVLRSPAQVLLVGGSVRDQERTRRLAAAIGVRNVQVLRPVAARAIWKYQCAADVLVLPLSGARSETARHTMPIKLFEYLGAGRAIVASNVETIREVVRHGVHAWLVAPDDPSALANGIDKVVQERDLRGRLADAARALAPWHTWEARAAAILAMAKAAGVW